MNKLIISIIALSVFTIFSCNSKTEKQLNKSENLEVNPNQSIDNDILNNSLDKTDVEFQNESINNTLGCGFEDGTYSATVDFNNSKTGYSATYTLDIDVFNCQVVQINFPNGGHLDSDHIAYADIDKDGNASIDGEDGKSYLVKIDN